VQPAPVWRRMVAFAYDALLLAAMWMIAAMAVMVANQLVPIADGRALMRVVMGLVGLAFFGWFWTHGGQTLGMRAWRLRVQQLDGTPVRPTASMLRYMAGLLPVICAFYGTARYGTPALAIALLGYLPCLIDARRRAFNDLIAGTQVVMLDRARRSAQAPQPPERDGDEQQRRQPG
jgi:uncharacterized RDD family membrane protein YckC